MPIIYTNTNPYQPNGYTPIQYGTGNGVVGNTFMTNFPYQDNGYAPVQVGIGTLPTPYTVDTTQVGTSTLPTPYTVDTTQYGKLPGPGNSFYNTYQYSDNIDTTQTGFRIGPRNEYYNTSQYSDNISPNQGSEEYADWRTQFPLLEKIYREPKVLRTYTKFPNAGTFYNLNSKEGVAESDNDVNLLAAGLTSAGLGVVGNLISGGSKKNDYKLLPKDKIEKIQNLPFQYQDYRQQIGQFGIDTRKDGASAAIRKSATAVAYAAASLAPGGAYSVFNLESRYGFGSYTGYNTPAKQDFTLRSRVATIWKNGAGTTDDGTPVPGGWKQTINPIELATQFRGDKVNVIDFKQVKDTSEIYKWLPPSEFEAINDFIGTIPSELGIGTTSDLIKFYFTGPKLMANGAGGKTDDVLVFRAIISSMNDNFSAAWNPVKYIGRADPNYTYQGYGRQFDVSFTVYASSRDELKPMYRKLNYLASYTAPTYSNNTIVMQAPWMRITVGDLLVHQPVVLTSCNYTFVDADTTWETNLVKDPTMMQVPFKVDVNLQFNVITDYLPQKGGRMYTLAKEFEDNGKPKTGNNNWLSDAKDLIPKKANSETKASQQEDEKSGNAGSTDSFNSFLRDGLDSAAAADAAGNINISNLG
jgi:hypothetical protein